MIAIEDTEARWARTRQCVVPLILCMIVVYWLAGCSSGPPAPAPAPGAVLPAKPYVVAQQTVYGAKGAYEAALVLATAYAKLPRCPASTICSDQKIVDQVLRARDVARASFAAADSIVFAPDVGQNAVDDAIRAADASLQAFISITNTLRVTP